MTEKRLLQEGDVITLKTGHVVYAKVPEHFLYSSHRGSFKLVEERVEIDGNFSYLAGDYIVLRTALEGGGTGHGPGDVYPDGHHVYCKRIGGPSIFVDFYQTGSFTAMIEDIAPIYRAARRWVVPKTKGDKTT